MKKYISTIIFVMVIIVCNAFCFSGSAGKITVNNQIKLEREKGGTRSGTTTEVRAFYDYYHLLLEIENYTGMVWIEVSGTGGLIQQTFLLNNSGQTILDISSLQSGIYTLSVTLENGVYSGSFAK
jgi:Protein of unknown function (DUF3244).